jgi:hypothetical protein
MVLDLTGGPPGGGDVDATVAPSWGASFPLTSGGIQTSDPVAAATYSVTASTPPG